jgi:antitoxin (DNA-binding transcriptional repressor) of toxin-antitoxin stability system
LKFLSIRELRSNIAGIRKDLERDREIVLTVSGKPFAVLVAVDPSDMERDLLEIRRARARRAIENIRRTAKARGLDTLSSNQVDALIARARQAGGRARRRRGGPPG